MCIQSEGSFHLDVLVIMHHEYQRGIILTGETIFNSKIGELNKLDSTSDLSEYRRFRIRYVENAQ